MPRTDLSQYALAKPCATCETYLDETHALLPEIWLIAGKAVFELHLRQVASQGNRHLVDFVALVNETCQRFDSRMLRV